MQPQLLGRSARSYTDWAIQDPEWQRIEYQEKRTRRQMKEKYKWIEKGNKKGEDETISERM
jgi:hypothetical protein